MTRKQIAEMVKAIYKAKLDEIVVNPRDNTPAAQAYKNALKNNRGKPALPLQGGQKLSPVGDKSRGRVVKTTNRFVPKQPVSKPLDAGRNTALDNPLTQSNMARAQNPNIGGAGGGNYAAAQTRIPMAQKRAAAGDFAPAPRNTARQNNDLNAMRVASRDTNQDRPASAKYNSKQQLRPSVVQKPKPGGALAATTASTPPANASSGPEKIKMATQKAADDFKFTDKERAGKVSAERLKQFYQQKGLSASGKTTQDLRTFMNAAKNKTLDTKTTPATELQKANQAKLQAGRTATTSSVVGGQGVAALPSGPAKPSVQSNVPKPTARPANVGSTGPASPTMASNAQSAGQMAVNRIKQKTSYGGPK